MTTLKGATPNLQQISKDSIIPMGSFFDSLKKLCLEHDVRFVRPEPEPHYSAADATLIVPKTKIENDCLTIRIPKARPVLLHNALKIEAKRHNKRKGSDAYHKRVQKKWDKRVLKEGSSCKLSVHIPVQLSLPAPFNNLMLEHASLSN